MTIEFTLKTRKGAEYKGVIDDIDSDLLALKWNVSGRIKTNTVYARHHFYKQTPRSIGMHKMILECKLGRKLEKGELVDHKDLNGLNNTRDNLRLATPAENRRNAKALNTNTSGYKGVRKQGGKYRAQLYLDGKNRHLGMFD